MTAAFVLVTVALVALGSLRPALPELVRAHWSGLVVVLAAGAAVVGALRARAHSADRHEGALFALLPLALAAMYLQPQRIASDGIFYYTPLHSVVVDFDLQFENEYRVLGAEPGYFQRTETGRLPNNYSVGPAILWSPFFVLAHLLGVAGMYRPTGFGYPYFTFVATGTVLVGFAGVVALYRLVREYFSPAVAFTSVVFVWLATFHVWYMTFEPSMSHAHAMAAVTVYFLATHRGVRDLWGFVLMGALGGLVALVRWQNVVLLPVTLVVTAVRYGAPKPRELLAGALAFLAVFAPQLIYWKLLYGSFLLVPQGGGYLDWRAPELEGVLFSSRHGLFAWTPVVYLSVLGLLGFARQAPALGSGLLVSGLVVWWVNASVYDWWAGASFGSRRFDGMLPAFALGVAVVLRYLVPIVRQRPLLTLGVLLSPLVVWNVLLMGVYFTGAVPPDGPTSFRRAAADGVDLVYPHTGYPFSWPASLPRSLATGWPLSSYDLVGAQSPANNIDVRIGDTDALFLGRGWSLPVRGRDATHREIAPQGGEVFVTLFEPAPYTLEIRGRPGGRVICEWNETRLSEVVLDDAGRAIVAVARRHVTAGPNAIVLKPVGPARVFVSRLLITRPGEF